MQADAYQHSLVVLLHLDKQPPLIYKKMYIGVICTSAQ